MHRQIPGSNACDLAEGQLGSFSFANRASARSVARPRSRPSGGRGIGGGWPLNSVHDGRDVPTISRLRRQAEVAETGAHSIAYDRERTVDASAPDMVDFRSRYRLPREIRAVVRRVDDRERIRRPPGRHRSGRHRRCARSEGVQHRLDRFDLGSRFCNIAVLVIDVTPPVPTRLRIGRQIRTRRGLWIEGDEMVRVRPGIVPGVVDETLPDIADVLFASVESEMDAARATFRTVPGDEN